ncbi:MAG: hypothetical protein WCF25_09485 [Acidimicrobiales bacterium]
MRPKQVSTRITVALVMATVAALLAFAVPAQSAVARAKVTERLSYVNPATSTTIHITACWTNALRGDDIELDVQSTSTLLWRAVTHATISGPKGCITWARATGTIGKYPYRVDVRQGKSAVAVSSISLERTFGTISGAAFFKGEFGCQSSGTVSTGTQTYNYFCSLSAGPEAASDYLTFPMPTTCRSLTLRMVATGNPQGNPADKSTMVVEIQQDNMTQPALFVDNVLETFTYHLDSHAAALNIWDSPGNSDGDVAYFLTPGSTAICSSTTGV